MSNAMFYKEYKQKNNKNKTALKKIAIFQAVKTEKNFQHYEIK